MVELSSIQIPTYMIDFFKYGIIIILFFIILNIVTKCVCSIYQTVSETIKWHKMADDDDNDDYNDWLDDDDEDDEDDEI